MWITVLSRECCGRMENTTINHQNEEYIGHEKQRNLSKITQLPWASCSSCGGACPNTQGVKCALKTLNTIEFVLCRFEANQSHSQEKSVLNGDASLDSCWIKYASISSEWIWRNPYTLALGRNTLVSLSIQNHFSTVTNLSRYTSEAKELRIDIDTVLRHVTKFVLTIDSCFTAFV